MSSLPILSYLIFFPLVGVLFIYISAFGGRKDVCFMSKIIAMITSLLNLSLAIKMWFLFDPTVTEMQLTEKISWIDGYNIYYALGIDGISVFFVLLTAFLVPICILVSWNTITQRVKEYMILFLLLESLVIGAFCATDLILFYLFFEAVLIPMYLIIGIWGGENRVYASFKFFLYTFWGSIFMLVAVCYIYVTIGFTEFKILNVMLPNLDLSAQKILWLAFFISFAVKVPMWPFHTWLPDAHVQAPTAGSVILAGILLKLGGYGFLRISLPMFPEASIYFSDAVIILSVIAVVYTSLVALRQDDMKKLIAYSSVAHMGFVTAGIFAFNTFAIQGAIFQMISHGLISGALFICVGVLYDRMHTKEIAFYGGVTTKMPKYAFMFMLFMLASVGLPSTSGFVGEMMVIAGVFQTNTFYAVLIATSLVLGAAYMLWLFARVMFGEITNPKLKTLQDINIKEQISLVSIASIVMFIGIYPFIVTNDLSVAVKDLDKKISIYDDEFKIKLSDNESLNEVVMDDLENEQIINNLEAKGA